MIGGAAQVKSEVFAIRIVKLYKYLCEDKKEYVLSKQILRSGTSIGANLAESENAITKADFINNNLYFIKGMFRNIVLVKVTEKFWIFDRKKF
jgi:hypothetical protein